MSKTFLDLVVDQFQYGGKKYASSDKKEVTDELVDDYGWNWLIGTVNKYVYRYKNLQRERDLLKIATYQYIEWLKLGFHIPGPTSAIKRFFGFWINTTVATKSKYFPVFIGRLKKYKVLRMCGWPTLGANIDIVKKVLLDELDQTLKDLRSPLTRTEATLFKAFKLAERVWELDGYDKQNIHDTDTFNESKE